MGPQKRSWLSGASLQASRPDQRENEAKENGLALEKGGWRVEEQNVLEQRSDLSFNGGIIVLSILVSGRGQESGLLNAL